MLISSENWNLILNPHAKRNSKKSQLRQKAWKQIGRKTFLEGEKAVSKAQKQQHISWLWRCFFCWWHGPVRYCQSNYRKLLQDKHQCILKNNCAEVQQSLRIIATHQVDTNFSSLLSDRQAKELLNLFHPSFFSFYLLPFHLYSFI